MEINDCNQLNTMKKNAEISKCQKYRYTLRRTWDNSKKKAMFIGLNPSTADEVNDVTWLLSTKPTNFRLGYRGGFAANNYGQIADPCLVLLDLERLFDCRESVDVHMVESNVVRVASVNGAEIQAHW